MLRKKKFIEIVLPSSSKYCKVLVASDLYALTSVIQVYRAKTGILLRRDLDQEFSGREYFLDGRGNDDLEARGFNFQKLKKLKEYAAASHSILIYSVI